MKTVELYDKSKAIAFYEERYSSGYMDDWPQEKKQRVFNLVRGLGLPDEGEALDFGCGNGVFAEVLRQALPPGWKVYGTDISEVAVSNANGRYANCAFFTAADPDYAGRKFDFLFTHHVLEHVSDLHQAFQDMNDRLKFNAQMLHILPCGNEHSFERDVCRLRHDGIDPRLGNRFFFEDVGHVRRLTTEQLNAVCEEQGFALASESYSNQLHGAIDWITQSGPEFIRQFTDSTNAIDDDAKKQLTRLRRQLLFYSSLRRLAQRFNRRWAKRGKTIFHYLELLIGMPLYAFACSYDSYFKRKAREEWVERRSERNGSEMYLAYKR